ncbi:MAG TPA: hypothetical protein VK369_16490 [Segetibacter sp.]|nr:hypothetical protein [Segetibacter sp.]
MNVKSFGEDFNKASNIFTVLRVKFSLYVKRKISHGSISGIDIIRLNLL